MDGPRVALALGSGGARGYAHIGVLQVLSERGAQVVSIAGSSMGALVGGVYAAGRLDEYTEWVLGLRQLDVVRLVDLSLTAPGAIRADKVLARVHELVEGAVIEDLPLAYTAVATDLIARKEVWFQRGPLATAIRASIAIPGVITPVVHNGRLLVDGGVMDPVPVAPTAAVAADATIAVTLGGEHRGSVAGGHVTETAEDEPAEAWSGRFRRSASQLRDSEVVRSLVARLGGVAQGDAVDDAVAEEVVESLPAGLGKLDVMNQSLEAMQSVLTRYRLAGFPPDVLVSVPRDACRSLDFHRAGELIELGRHLTELALDRAEIAGLGAASDPGADAPAPPEDQPVPPPPAWAPAADAGVDGD